MAAPMLARPVLLAAVAALASLSLGACSGSGGSGDGGAAAPGPSDTSASPSAAATSEAPRLEADPSGISAACSARAAQGDVKSFWGPTVTATGDLTITSVGLDGGGLRLLGVDGLTTSMPDDDRQSGTDDRWPTSNRFLPGKVATAARGPLEGRAVPSGTQVLPVVGVEIEEDLAGSSGASMRGLRIDYTWGDGSQSATVAVPYNRSFVAGAC